jgi:hypothetical protein
VITICAGGGIVLLFITVCVVGKVKNYRLVHPNKMNGVSKLADESKVNEDMYQKPYKGFGHEDGIDTKHDQNMDYDGKNYNQPTKLNILYPG